MKNLILARLVSIIFAVALFSALTTTPAAGQTIIKTPQEAAQGLFQTWSRKQKKTSQNFARQEAIEKLFGVRKQKMTFKGCTKREEGDFECIYENKKNDLSLAMIVKIYRAGYRVASVSFSSEAI